MGVDLPSSVDALGFVRAKLTVGDITGSRMQELTFLVDTGSYYTVMPPRVADELGIKSLRRGRVTLADKRVVEVDISAAYVKALDREAPILVAIMDTPEPIVGVEALEALGVAVDPSTGELKYSRPYGLLV